MAISGEAALAWAPSGDERHACQTSEPCPACGEPLTAGRRGTWRVCTRCRTCVVPAAVSAPYARGESAPQRQVASQRERDLAALDLASRKGAILARLAALAADDGLGDEDRPVAEWFRDQVKAARSASRLDELDELLASLPVWDDGDDQAAEDRAPAAAPAIPAAPRVLPGPAPVPARPVTPEDALAILRLTLPLASSAGGCQVAEYGVRCGAEATFSIEVHGNLAWLCTRHNYAVCKILRTRRQA